MFGYNGAACTIDAVRVRSWISCTNGSPTIFQLHNLIDARRAVVLLLLIVILVSVRAWISSENGSPTQTIIKGRYLEFNL